MKTFEISWTEAELSLKTGDDIMADVTLDLHAEFYPGDEGAYDTPAVPDAYAPLSMTMKKIVAVIGDRVVEVPREDVDEGRAWQRFLADHPWIETTLAKMAAEAGA